VIVMTEKIKDASRRRTVSKSMSGGAVERRYLGEDSQDELGSVQLSETAQASKK